MKLELLITTIFHTLFIEHLDSGGGGGVKALLVYVDDIIEMEKIENDKLSNNV